MITDIKGNNTSRSADEFHSRLVAVRATQPRIARNEVRLQRFGEHYIRRVVSS